MSSREIRRQEQHNKTLVRQMFREVIEREELDDHAVARYFSPRYVQKVDGKTLDLADFVDHVRELKRTVTHLRVTFEHMVSEGNKVMDIHRVDADKRVGAKITARVISLWIIEDGKIVLCDELTHLEKGAPGDRDLGSRTSVANSS
jgi:ketosteroid isomerase-like protein